MPSSQARRDRRRCAPSDGRPRISTSSYRYKRLPNDSSIRILELLPSPDGEIICTLKIVDLRSNPVFDALSYCWANPITIRESPIPPGAEGHDMVQPLLSLQSIPTVRHSNVVLLDPGAASFLSVHGHLPYMDREHGRDRCKTILCDGAPMLVTATLFSALLQLCRVDMDTDQAGKQPESHRDEHHVLRSKSVWIDQICINQDNIDERNAQVHLMNKIFSRAQYVFAWIGDLDTLGLAGLEVLIDRARNPVPTDSPKSAHISYERVGKERKDLYALTALLSRQWFRRAWVAQEAVFARRLYLWSGSTLIDWWLLVAALKTINEVDISRMAKFMGSLVRREPTGRMCRKLVRVRPRLIGKALPTSAVTDKEILSNVRGAVSFVEGVVQVKKALGLQCYNLPAQKRPALDDVSGLRFGTFIVGGAVTIRGQGGENLIMVRSDGQTFSQFVQHSLSDPIIRTPYKAAEFHDGQESTEVCANPSFFGHNFDPEKPSAPVSISLFSLIARFRDVGASDARDKVFAFLHMATETPDLKPDYRVRTQYVFMAAAKLLLDQHNLTVLSHVQDPEATNIKDLPSWIPDFSVPLGRTPFVAHDGSSPYSAGGGRSGQPNFYIVAEDKEGSRLDIMAVYGYFLDTVAAVAEPSGCYFTRVGSLALQTPKLYTKDASPLYVCKSRLWARPSLEAGRLTRVEALWRTLTGDFCSGVYPAPVSTGFGFAEWVSAHLHHSEHLRTIAQDHHDAVAPEAVSAEMKALFDTQKQKQDIWGKLHAEEAGGYLCYDCATEFWKEKMQDLDKAYVKKVTEQIGAPEMNPVRYIPDGHRYTALYRCIRTEPPRTNVDSAATCPVLTVDEHTRMKAFEDRMREVKAGRTMFRTKTNLLGMGPLSTREGDEVWVLMGAKVPFVLRPVDNGKAPKRYKLVGEAYVHGYMDGEILSEKRDLQAFGLV